MRISGQSILAALPQNVKDGKDPVVFQGLNPPGPEASIGYTFPALLIDHAMRNPHVPTTMPSFYRTEGLSRVGSAWKTRPVLTAQQIEDVVALLRTLRD